MLKDVVTARALPNHRILISFEDGVEGTVNLTDLVPFEGIFAPLRDQTAFAQLRVNTSLGAIEWPNGADLDPDVLYAHITGTGLPQYQPTSKTP